MFKKVMHTSGTRFFGSLLIDSYADLSISVAPSAANSTINITDSSPFTILDRQVIEIEDRNDLFIEIRE